MIIHVMLRRTKRDLGALGKQPAVRGRGRGREGRGVPAAPDSAQDDVSAVAVHSASSEHTGSTQVQVT